MKSISTTNPAIMENMKSSIIKTLAPIIDLQVGLSLDRSVSLLLSPATPNTLGNIPSIRSAPASTAFTQVSH